VVQARRPFGKSKFFITERVAFPSGPAFSASAMSGTLAWYLCTLKLAALGSMTAKRSTLYFASPHAVTAAGKRRIE